MVLTRRRLRFVAQYIRDFNGTRAAVRAGYSPHSAANSAYRLLRHPEVQAEIERALADEQRRLGIATDRVVLELMRVAFSDIRDYLVAGADGALALKPSASLTAHQTAAIAALSVGSPAHGHGPSIRLHGKRRALAALARHLGFDDTRIFADPRLEIEADERLSRELFAAAGLDAPKALPAPDGDRQ